jgi:hypothetical protein
VLVFRSLDSFKCVSAEVGTRAPYTLLDGLGSRRLQQFKVRTHVQSLLVQSCMAIYDHLNSVMPDVAVCDLLGTVSEVCDHARAVCFLTRGMLLLLF